MSLKYTFIIFRFLWVWNLKCLSKTCGLGFSKGCRHLKAWLKMGAQTYPGVSWQHSALHKLLDQGPWSFSLCWLECVQRYLSCDALHRGPQYSSLLYPKKQMKRRRRWRKRRQIDRQRMCLSRTKVWLFYNLITKVALYHSCPTLFIKTN